jgi:hypothetical protein
MTITLDRIDTAPIADSDFDYQFTQWIWVLIDTLNETLATLENSINLFTANNLALRTETVTLTSGLPTFTVANGALYNVGDNVIGSGIPASSNIVSIAVNTITLNHNATLNGAHALTFIPITGDIGNGILLYDTTNNVYVGMQNGALVKFTTSPYP